MSALIRVYLIASGAHEPRAQTPFLSQVFLTRYKVHVRVTDLGPVTDPLNDKT